jgi:hypothetical protein
LQLAKEISKSKLPKVPKKKGIKTAEQMNNLRASLEAFLNDLANVPGIWQNFAMRCFMEGEDMTKIKARYRPSAAPPPPTAGAVEEAAAEPSLTRVAGEEETRGVRAGDDLGSDGHAPRRPHGRHVVNRMTRVPNAAVAPFGWPRARYRYPVKMYKYSICCTRVNGQESVLSRNFCPHK